MKLRIPHDAWVIICDAHKAMVLRNHGNATQPELKVQEVEKAARNPSNAHQGSDRPGRMQNAVGPTSATEETDLHELAEYRFALDTAAILSQVPQSRDQRDIILVAPPRVLALLRKNLDDRSRARILAEVDKDLTKHPIDEIERLFSSY
jgi:protein required for attachment to host cells